MLALLKKKLVASKYIGSGLLDTAARTISGLLVLRWLQPQELGQGQSLTVFNSYLQVLSLGITSGLNRGK